MVAFVHDITVENSKEHRTSELSQTTIREMTDHQFTV